MTCPKGNGKMYVLHLDYSSLAQYKQKIPKPAKADFGIFGASCFIEFKQKVSIINGFLRDDLCVAKYMGVSVKTVEAWEAGRNHPEGAACRLLSMTRSDPAFPQKSGIVTAVARQ